jgi:WhiB family redox-sensing transcriptional regulator
MTTYTQEEMWGIIETGGREIPLPHGPTCLGPDNYCGTANRYKRGCREPICRADAIRHERARRAADPSLRTFESAVGRVLPTVMALDEEPWAHDLACAGQNDTMFPNDAHGVHVAKAICDTCHAKDECLEFALKYRQNSGVWGGASERERKKILRQRARDSA